MQVTAILPANFTILLYKPPVTIDCNRYYFPCHQQQADTYYPHQLFSIKNITMYIELCTVYTSILSILFYMDIYYKEQGGCCMRYTE